jgi:hypothetical protein
MLVMATINQRRFIEYLNNRPDRLHPFGSELM